MNKIKTYEVIIYGVRCIVRVSSKGYILGKLKNNKYYQPLSSLTRDLEFFDQHKQIKSKEQEYHA